MKEGKLRFKNTDGKPAFSDILGKLRMRLGIKRSDYRVNPGLYALNSPGAGSPVLVSANYKLSFDVLRAAASDLDAWILVLDTKGINVWCAAGKGTFGTEELIKRVKKSGLSKYLSHKTLILPQLGASGVAAHKVKAKTGFTVKFGPVEAYDLRKYLENGQKCDEAMRTISFPLAERLVLTPVEMVLSWPLLLGSLSLSVLCALISGGLPVFLSLLSLSVLAILTGTLLVPALLPYIPGSSFAWKGWITGLISSVIYLLLAGISSAVFIAGALFLFPAISAFLALNFTGSTTFTSPSGVKKEMLYAIPFCVISAAAGLVFLFYFAFRGFSL